jgi:hypothetical protein
MFGYRYAVTGGVSSGTRGGSVIESLYRRPGQAQVASRGGARVWMTIRRKAVCGHWKGEHSLRLNAVLFVQRQPRPEWASVNRKKIHEKQTYSTQRVGITLKTLVEKARAASGGETLVVSRGPKDHRLAPEALLVPQRPYQPFSLNQFVMFS